MLKTSVFNLSTSQTSEIELSDKIFAVKSSPDLIHQAVVAELANRRNVVAHTKTRGEVRGGGKKPWRQKGTGRARAGSIRSPLWKGGGVTFGPRARRNYKKALNRPMFRKSLLMTLSERLRENCLFVIEPIALPGIKTKDFVKQLQKIRKELKISAKSVNVVIARPDKSLELSARNLPDVEILRVSEITPYKLLLQSATLIYRDALPEIERMYLKNN